MPMRKERIRDLRTGIIGPDLPTGTDGPVVYWVTRDHRVQDNWALLYAVHAASQLSSTKTVRACFCLPTNYLRASERQYDFLCRGLQEFERDCASLGISFDVLTGEPEDQMSLHIHHLQPSLVVVDQEPIRIKRQWVDAVMSETHVAIHQVDAHNIVPVWIASNKEESAARTLRPKIVGHLSTYLEEIPTLQPLGPPLEPATDWEQVYSSTDVNPLVGPVPGVDPGPAEADVHLHNFLLRLESYEHRNDPTVKGQSGLSPYLHFGHLSAQRVALAVIEKLGLSSSDLTDIRSVSHGFLEELIVRRELSDNFTYYQPNYESFDGFPEWAQRTLNLHRNDPREYEYDLDQWESAETHDQLWNAAQRELINTGRMHGYMRMYWAKKLLEWSHNPEEALAIGITLNDSYMFDGRDPNGYAGLAWSIGGVHDRPWPERPVFGNIRFMNASGCRRKFDVDAYIAANSTPLQ